MGSIDSVPRGVDLSAPRVAGVGVATGVAVAASVAIAVVVPGSVVGAWW